MQLRYIIGISVFYHDSAALFVPNVAPRKFQVQARGLDSQNGILY
jgi:hypothetical protein